MPGSTSPSRACSPRAWWCTRPIAGPTARWVSPAEIRIESDGGGPPGRTPLATAQPVEIGSIEKMSKSKRNTVDPDDIIGTYGADTARWFMLSDLPPERDVIWTEEGVQGASRFVQRLWRLTGEIAGLAAPAGTPMPAMPSARQRWRSARPRTGR